MATVQHREQPIALAIEAARRMGLNTDDAALLRVAAGAHVVLPHADVVARVESLESNSTARRQVVIARLLATLDVPAARLIPGEQPIVLEHGVVTLWARLHSTGRQVGPKELGRLARNLHDATQQLLADSPSLDPVDPFGPVGSWLNCETNVPEPAGTNELRSRIERAMAQWPETVASASSPLVLVHGDLHTDNAIETPSGSVLLDFEDSGRGPAAWDALHQVLATRRYGGPTDAYQRFAEGYGRDLLGENSGSTELCEAMELSLAAWAVGNRGASPAMRREAEIRVASVTGGIDRMWTLL